MGHIGDDSKVLSLVYRELFSSGEIANSLVGRSLPTNNHTIIFLNVFISQPFSPEKSALGDGVKSACHSLSSGKMHWGRKQSEIYRLEYYQDI